MNKGFSEGFMELIPEQLNDLYPAPEIMGFQSGIRYFSEKYFSFQT